jgi:hypothetical protein
LPFYCGIIWLDDGFNVIIWLDDNVYNLDDNVHHLDDNVYHLDDNITFPEYITLSKLGINFCARISY